MNVNSNSKSFRAIYNLIYLGSYWHPSFESEEVLDRQILSDYGYSSKEIDIMEEAEFEKMQSEEMKYFKVGSADDFSFNFVAATFDEFLNMLNNEEDIGKAA